MLNIKFLKHIAPYLFLLCVVATIFTRPAQAQTFTVKGKVTDNKETPIPGAAVVLIKKSDTTQITGEATNINGEFQFKNIKPSTYILRITYVSFSTYEQPVIVKNSNITIPGIKLKEKVVLLKEVSVETNQIRAVQKGDSLEFNASAYKTNPDATAEDLLKKMPGVTSDGSAVKVNGEEIKKVLVDGKPFFGDDPSATLKNLPAEMVDKIQVFDKLSEQAQFTGFNDGDEQKTLNIVTKEERNAGQFGKIYLGYGTDDRYNAGLAINQFKGARRVSLLGMTNNINQQNFNISDIMSVMENSGAQRGREGGHHSGAANFFSGNQSGNTNTNALGINYVDSWGSKISVSGSYFFNNTNNTNNSSSIRNYFTGNKLIYVQNSTSKTENLNHRANFKFEYNIDSSNSLTIMPRITFQNNNNETYGTNKFSDDSSSLSNTTSKNVSDNNGINFQNDILYMHKFAKKGRTVSLNFNSQTNNRDGDGSYYSSSLYNDTTDIYEVTNQTYTNNSKSLTLGGSISYTEPITRNVQLQITYRPSQTESSSDKLTYSTTGLQGENLFDSTLSNKYNNTYTTQRGGLNLKIKTEKMNFSAGADFQNYLLDGEQTFPYTSVVKKEYNNILPSANFNYKFSKTKNLSVRYRSQTKSPAITQLQNVIDASNPLQIKAGNMDLLPSYDNNLMFRLGLINPESSKNFFIFLMASASNNYISNATYSIKNDTVIQGYNINKGSQLTIPVNLDNYQTIRSFGVYSLPLNKIKSNLNLNAGYSFTHTPAIIDNELNYSFNNAVNGGFYLSSNISQYIDFSLAYNGSYNSVKNSLYSQSNSSYYNHTLTFRSNFILFKRLVINTDINQMTYQGLSESYNQNYILWNAYLGYKFLKNQSLEAKLSVYDILNQNTSVSRTITESYTEDSNTEILKRYAMLTLTYTIKNFKNNNQNTEQQEFRFMPPPPQGGGGQMMPPPPGAF